MAESLPNRGIISTYNLVVDDINATVVSATSEKNLWRKENLRDQRRSKRWRSTSAVEQKIVVRLSAAALPEVFALVDSNLAASQTVTLKGADDAAMTTNVASWSLTTYTQSMRHTLRWYLGAADSGTASARLYWEVTFPASGAGSVSYHELGVLWLGAHVDLVISSLDRSVIDPSEIAVSDGGARYPDRRDTYHETSIDSDAMPEADSWALLDALDSAGGTRHVIVDLWASSSDSTRKANGTYYATLGGGEGVGQFSRSTPVHDDLSLLIVEARA